MSAPDGQDIVQWQESLRWLDRAAEDIRAARTLLRGGIILQAVNRHRRVTPSQTRSTHGYNEEMSFEVGFRSAPTGPPVRCRLVMQLQ